MMIVINAGHCPGLDPGAVGPTGLQEATVCKNVANQVISYLAQAGVDAHFVQDDSLYNIVDCAEAMHAELLVSIHCNAAANPAAIGAETFYYADSLKSLLLGGAIHRQLVGLGLEDRGVKDGSQLYVLRKSSMPAVLAEIDFISNPEREAWLADERNQTEVARAIARGITDYQAGVQ